MQPLPGLSASQCIRGRVYYIEARNFDVGVYDGNLGFIGIRSKFGSRFLDTEYHWDQGPPYGTVHGVVDTGVDCPLDQSDPGFFAFLSGIKREKL